ncbi:MAG: GntR family transcriptional regulator [Cellulomonadaceae bacterium]
MQQLDRPTAADSRPSAAERAYATIRERILDGDIPGGTLISEGELATDLAMSRTPVREAFLRLQAEGWMRLYPKRGALVRAVEPAEIADIVEARHLIESDAARRATARASTAEQLVATLEGLLEAQREAAHDEDLSTFAQADLAFHQAVVEAGGNSILADVYRSLHDRQRRMTARSVRSRRDRMALVVEQHAELVRLVAAQDSPAYATALLAHMRDIHQDLLR